MGEASWTTSGILGEYDANGNLKVMVKYDMDQAQTGAQETMLLQIKHLPQQWEGEQHRQLFQGRKKGLFRQHDDHGRKISGDHKGRRMRAGERYWCAGGHGPILQTSGRETKCKEGEWTTITGRKPERKPERCPGPHRF